MVTDTTLKNIVIKFTIAFAASVMIAFPLVAAERHFQNNNLTSGYILAHKDGECGMNKMDSDGDGVISKDEFMAHAEKKFSKKDKNGDGVISEEEKKEMKKGDKEKCKNHKSHS